MKSLIRGNIWLVSEPRDDDLYPASRRRRTLAAGAAVAGAAVLIVAVFATSRGSGDGPPTLGERVIETTTTSRPSVTTTTTPVATSVVISPVEVEFGLGSAVIARHIRCRREDRLSGTSVEAVEAAVAADNDIPDGAGGPKPYAHDAAAQDEIVRASLLVLRRTKRFYADCAPVTGPRRATTASETPGATSPEDTDQTLPPSR